jgi:hypothetical protein
MMPSLLELFSGSFVFLAAVLLAFDSVMVIGILRKRKEKDTQDASSPSVTLQAPMATTGGSTKRELVMSIVSQLEKQLYSTGFRSAGEEERKWYGKARNEIEAIKRSVDQGDYGKAKRSLGSAELYLKMLELSIAGR